MSEQTELVRNHFYLFTFNPDKLELRKEGCFLKEDFQGSVMIRPVFPEKGTFPVESGFSRLGAGYVVVAEMYFRYQNDGEQEDLEVSWNEVDIDHDHLAYILERFVRENDSHEIRVRSAPGKNFRAYYKRKCGDDKWKFGGKDED